MCRNHEACTFTYDVTAKRVVGKVIKIEPLYIPFAAQAPDGSTNGATLSSWITSRAVPPARENVRALLGSLGLSSTEELMLFGLGLSLSDQYWFRPSDVDLDWDDVKLFGRSFSDDVGQILVSHDETSMAAALARLRRRSEISSSSPDAALNGNLPKFWSSQNGQPRLYKTGRASCLYLEPYCEAATTELCRAILPPDRFVPYTLDGFRDEWPLGSCPSFTDDTVEFVPAADIFQLAPRDNSSSRYERYARLLESKGITDARTALAEMLVVDHIIGNFDRHWGNFGILVDAESRKWLRCAPLFDMGESFDCDRAIGTHRLPRRAQYRLPFLTRIDEQMGRFAEELEWFDGALARAAVEKSLRIISAAPLLASYRDLYLATESRQLESRIAGVERKARERGLIHAVSHDLDVEALPIDEERPHTKHDDLDR
jgi:hypothetical protein